MCNSPEKQVSVGIATKKVETCSKMLKVFWFTPFWFVPLQWIITNLFYLLVIYWVAYQVRLLLQSGVTHQNSCFCHHCHWLDHCRNSKQLYFLCDLSCNRGWKELHETNLCTKLLKCTHKCEHVTATLERTRNFVS